MASTSAAPAPAAQLEIPIFGPNGGVVAVQNGARRLELNRAGSYAVGGLTPTLDELAALIDFLSAHSQPRVPIRIMIRPRGPPPPRGDNPDGQDFLYTPSEITDMLASIRSFKDSGLLDASRGDGFVFGALLRGDNLLEIDPEANKWLVRMGRPFKCVLHRAFDEVLSDSPQYETMDAVYDLVDCEFDGVLTSGGKRSVSEPGNVERLADVIRKLRGRAEVVVGGGVRSWNVHELRCAFLTEGLWFHSSCLFEELSCMRFDEREVRAVVEGLSS
ncbi:copper homeostasis CutC domain-containing protein [Podospora aff. communis PSN243]|uniref:Copper homeostasis protein cutC homolog n=1 Tax=Podospora aff. communis PSN243 TaxID=3040156 RepID=A0AAV9GZH4_9PEZI|nr:copper homeostasis CutC domain-containing protein [Podospora aff. communis PSN243]